MNGNGDELDHPMRRAEDFDAGAITEAELPRYLYRELRRVKKQLDRAMKALRELEQAVFGHQEGSEWIDGLAQNLIAMRELSAENQKLLLASRRWIRRIGISAAIAVVVLVLDSVHPGWGDAVLRAIGIRF